MEPVLSKLSEKAGKALMKKLRKNKKVKISINQITILNLSSHPITDKAKTMLNKTFGNVNLINIKIPTVSLSKLDEETVKIVEEIISKMKNTDQLLQGQFFIIPPGYPPLAISLMSFLHGLTGNFPNLLFLEKNQKSPTPEYLPINIIYDMNNLRETGRNIRNELM